VCVARLARRRVDQSAGRAAPPRARAANAAAQELPTTALPSKSTLNSGMAFGWFVWIRGYDTGPTIIDRISWED